MNYFNQTPTHFCTKKWMGLISIILISRLRHFKKTCVSRLFGDKISVKLNIRSKALGPYGANEVDAQMKLQDKIYEKVL